MKVILNGQASHQHLLYEADRVTSTINRKKEYLAKAEASALWRDEAGIQDAKYVIEDCENRLELLNHLIAMGSSCSVELDL